MTTTFSFVELPEGNRRGRAPDPLLVEFADVLRANPQKWAKWPKPLSEALASNYAYNIRKAKNAPFQDGTFDARVVAYQLYVCHKGA